MCSSDLARGQRGDHRAAAQAVSLLYQPPAMRFRAINVLTNTPTRLFQRSPGEMQGIAIVERAVVKAAKQLGLDQVQVRKINAPVGKAPFGPPAENGKRAHTTSAFVREALDRGAENFGWRDRVARSGKRNGSKVRGVGVAVGTHTAGSVGHDGLLTIRPDGKLYVQSGVGNLGTHSLFDLARVTAELLAIPWEKVEVAWGNTSRHLPYSCLSVGSQTTHAMTRASHAAAMDAGRKLREIAARDLATVGRLAEESCLRMHATCLAARPAVLYWRPATLTVIDGARQLPVTFEKDVQPILTRYGCNAGQCHGKSRGQNGFQLSLLGFDSDFDFAALKIGRAHV